MKKKIFSTLACLMLCFTAMFMVSGCGEKDDKTPIAEEKAMEVMATAMESMQEYEKFMISGSFSMMVPDEGAYGMSLKYIMVEDTSYSEESTIMGDEYEKIASWEYLVDGTYTLYTKAESSEGAEYSYETYSAEDGGSSAIDFEDLGNFLEAYTKGEKTYIVLDSETMGMPCTLTVIIENNLIRTMRIDVASVVTFDMHLTYGDEVTEVIPTRPTDVKWEGEPEVTPTEPVEGDSASAEVA